MKRDLFISVIAPLHNDADTVEPFIKETLTVLQQCYTNYELVLVDDGSKDDTAGRIEKLLSVYEGVRLLCLSREFGEEVAISAGLDMVIGDFVVVMSLDMDPPRLIPELVECAIKGADVVVGVRRKRADEGWLTRKGVALFYWYCRKWLRLDLLENATHFCCLSRLALNAITQIKDSHRYLRLSSSYVGYKRQSFVYDPIRHNKKKNRRFIQSVNEAISLIIENSPHPLRFVSMLGLCAAATNLLYALYIFTVYFIKEDVQEGWTTLSLQNATQFFFIALILAALSEYTGRILNRLRDRPLYYVREEHNSNVLLVDQNRRNVLEELGTIDLDNGQ